MSVKIIAPAAKMNILDRTMPYVLFISRWKFHAINPLTIKKSEGFLFPIILFIEGDYYWRAPRRIPVPIGCEVQVPPVQFSGLPWQLP